MSQKRHNPNTIALDPRLFKLSLMAGGVLYSKKKQMRMAGHLYLCKNSDQPIYMTAAQRSCDRCAAKDDQAAATDSRLRDLVSGSSNLWQVWPEVGGRPRHTTSRETTGQSSF